VGGARHYRVVGLAQGDHAGALEVADAVLGMSAPRAPTQAAPTLRVTWRPGSVATLAPVRLHLARAHVEAHFQTRAPCRLYADMVAHGARWVWGHQDQEAGRVGVRLDAEATDAGVRGRLAWSFGDATSDVALLLQDRIAAAQQAGLIPPVPASRLVDAFFTHLRPSPDAHAATFVFDGVPFSCHSWGRGSDGMAIPLQLLVPLPSIGDGVLSGAGSPWYGDRPVDVTVHAGQGVDAAVHAAAHDPDLIELTLERHYQGRGAGDVERAVVEVVGPDHCTIEWDCRFEGAVGGYNSVTLVCNGTDYFEPCPGGTEVVVSVNYKSEDPDGIAARIGDHIGRRLDHVRTE